MVNTVVNHVLYQLAVKTTPAEFKLLVHLANKAAPGGGDIFPDETRLVAWTKFAPGTIARMVRQFKQRGWLLEVAKVRGKIMRWRLGKRLWKSCAKPHCFLCCGVPASTPICTSQYTQRHSTGAGKRLIVPRIPSVRTLLEGKNSTYIRGPVENDAESTPLLRAKAVMLRAPALSSLRSGRRR